MALADALRTFMYVSLWGKPVISVARGLSGLIKSIFRAGEQGFAYDINDLTTLYQDAAGTTPVTAAGQPVGLVLDKSKGLVLGVERLVNWDFSSAGTGWTVLNADATHSITFENGAARYKSDTSTPVLSLQQNTALTAGKWYEVEVTISSKVSGSLKVEAANGLVMIVNSIGTTKAKLLAGSGIFSIVRAEPNTDITIDSISVRELAGNHAYQTTSASRPLLQRNAMTGAYYLAFDGTDDFLVTGSIDFTATDKISLFAGVRKLSDASTGVVAEFSINSDSVLGAFRLLAPALSGASKYAASSRGTSDVVSTATTTDMQFNAPSSAILSAKSQISTDTLLLRVNGSQVAQSTADQGTGNYGNHPLYIGRRGGTSLPFNGHLYSLIGAARLSTDAETTALEKAIAKNVGVTL